MNLGGIETFLMTLYRNIDRTKVQFDFLVHRNEKGFFDDEIQSLGGNIMRIRPLNPFQIIKYYGELNEIFSKTSYNIIHSHLNANSAIILKIAKKKGINHRIAHSHTHSSTNDFNGLIKILNKTYINNVCNHKIACSKSAGLWLFGNKVEFKIINNSIETSTFSFDDKIRLKVRNLLSIEENTIVVGNIARFNQEKNHDFIIDIFYELNNLKKSKLLLIGEGKLQSTIKEKVKRLGLTKQVIFTGAVKNANEYLNAMDVFIFPSNFEGLGIVAVEAQTNGLPVVMNKSLPSELDLTNLTYRLPLNYSVDSWAKCIIKAYEANRPRKSKIDEIKAKSYDIKENVSLLEDFYLNLD